MVTKQIIKHPKAVIEVQVTVPWADIEKAYNDTLTRLAQEVELPGFRKGAAPLNMVEPRIASNISQELVKNTMPQALIDALQGETIVPIDYPQYTLISFSKGNDLEFSARLTEKPVVKIGDYKTIKKERPAMKQVGDEEVQKLVDDLFKRWKARQPVTATPQAATAQPSQPQAVGSMSFNAPANAQPASTLDTPAAPVAAVASEVPDDTFAKAVGAESLEDLKKKIRADLENEAKYNSELDYEESILQEVEKMTTVEVPEVLIQDELNRMLVSLQRRITDAGMLFDDYLRSQGKTLESLKLEWRPQAETNVRMELGLAEIARMESVEIADQELQAEIDKIQDNRVKQQFNSQEPRMHLRHALRQTKTLNLLKTLVG